MRKSHSRAVGHLAENRILMTIEVKKSSQEFLEVIKNIDMILKLGDDESLINKSDILENAKRGYENIENSINAEWKKLGAITSISVNE